MLPVTARSIRRYRSRLILASSVATMFLCGSTGSAHGQARAGEVLPPPQAPAAVVPATIPIYTLADCVRIALEKQPAIAAARAGLTAKEINRDFLANTSPLACVVAPDIKIRLQQAQRGVSAAQALLQQTESETLYAVTRTYFTAIYARMQQDVTNDVVENLKFYHGLVGRIIQGAGPEKEINQGTLDRLDIYLNLARTKHVDAEEGVKRALAALREAMGIGLECSSFQLADVVLPEPAIVPVKCDIINLALARRGEMTQVLLAAEVIRLEVDAQGRFLFRPTVRTFAASSDIHAQQVPPGMRNGEYRPGAIGVEMPNVLNGSRDTRKSLAGAYGDRADAVVAKTRELIALEAEDAYLKWSEANRKVTTGRDAANRARKLARQTRDDANAGARIRQDEILQTDILAGQATAAYYEAAFQQILALAGLERITAGGFSSGLIAPPQPKQP